MRLAGDAVDPHIHSQVGIVLRADIDLTHYAGADLKAALTHFLNQLSRLLELFQFRELFIQLPHPRSSQTASFEREPPGSAPQVIVGDKQFRELSPIVVPLLDVVDTGGFHEVDAWPVVQPADKGVVVVGEQEFALDPHQGVPQADVVGFGETVFTNVLVIPSVAW